MANNLRKFNTDKHKGFIEITLDGVFVLSPDKKLCNSLACFTAEVQKEFLEAAGLPLHFIR